MWNFTISSLDFKCVGGLDSETQNHRAASGAAHHRVGGCAASATNVTDDRLLGFTKRCLHRRRRLRQSYLQTLSLGYMYVPTDDIVRAGARGKVGRNGSRNEGSRGQGYVDAGEACQS